LNFPQGVETPRGIFQKDIQLRFSQQCFSGFSNSNKTNYSKNHQNIIKTMRSIWKSSINFGLINIPVKLFSAVPDSGLDLDMLDRNDHANIKYKRVNENTGKEVEYADIVKGYKLDDNYVILEDADFEAADAETTKTTEILNFVKESEIDSIYYEHPYYLEPEKSAKLLKIIKNKAKGKKSKVPKMKIVHKQSDDLTGMLKASLETKKRKTS
jgi:non-homologous end joining protein Ku